MLALQRAQSEERGDIVSVMVLALPCSSDSRQVPLPSGPCMSCQYHGGVGLASRHVPSQDSPQDPGNRTPSWSQGGGRYLCQLAEVSGLPTSLCAQQISFLGRGGTSWMGSSPRFPACLGVISAFAQSCKKIERHIC